MTTLPDQSAILQAEWITATGEVILPAGPICINAGIVIPPSVKGLKVCGNSTYGTVLQTNASGIWAQNNGFELSDLTIEDTSGTGAVSALLRVSNALDLNLQRVQFNGAAGRHYTAGGVTVANGSAQVFGVKTVWTADMGPGHIWINGYCQEVAAVTSAATLTLATPWQHPSVTNAAYSLDYGGAGLKLDGNGGGCTQYASVVDCLAINCRVGVYCVGQAVKAGVSRIGFRGGRYGCFNNQRIPNSIGFWAGQFTDTVVLGKDVAIQNVALGVGIENGHSHVIEPFLEHDQPYCSVTGMATGQPATKGVLLTGTGTTAATNKVAPGVAGYGNAIEYNAAAGFEIAVDVSRIRPANVTQVQVVTP